MLKNPLSVDNCRNLLFYKQMTKLIHILKPNFPHFLQMWVSLYFTTVFSDGFESNDFTAWSDITQSDGTAVVEAVNPHHGTYNGKFTITVAGGNANCYKLFDATAIAYYRFYIKILTGIPIGENSGYLRIGLIRNNAGAQANNIIELHITYDVATSRTQWGVDIGGSGYVESSSSNPTTGIWYCVEILRDNTNDLEKVWIDGVLKISQTVALTGDADLIRCGIFYTNVISAASVVCDCVVISDTYIGMEPPTDSNIALLIKST